MTTDPFIKQVDPYMRGILCVLSDRCNELFDIHLNEIGALLSPEMEGFRVGDRIPVSLPSVSNSFVGDIELTKRFEEARITGPDVGRSLSWQEVSERLANGLNAWLTQEIYAHINNICLPDIAGADGGNVRRLLSAEQIGLLDGESTSNVSWGRITLGRLERARSMLHQYGRGDADGAKVHLPADEKGFLGLLCQAAGNTVLAGLQARTNRFIVKHEVGLYTYEGSNKAARLKGVFHSGLDATSTHQGVQGAGKLTTIMTHGWGARHPDAHSKEDPALLKKGDVLFIKGLNAVAPDYGHGPQGKTELGFPHWLVVAEDVPLPDDIDKDTEVGIKVRPGIILDGPFQNCQAPAGDYGKPGASGGPNIPDNTEIVVVGKAGSKRREAIMLMPGSFAFTVVPLHAPDPMPPTEFVAAKFVSQKANLGILYHEFGDICSASCDQRVNMLAGLSPLCPEFTAVRIPLNMWPPDRVP